MGKLVYSLHTQPIKQNRWGQGNRYIETIKMFHLSILQASDFHDITLYVSDNDALLFDNLPIDIKILNKKPDNLFWTTSKIEAIDRTSGKFIHIDGDVFLSKPLPDFDDIMIERIEMQQFNKHYKTQLDKIERYQRQLPFYMSLNYSFNHGVVGFADSSKKNVYIESFDVWKRELRSVAKSMCEPNIIVEQYLLACIADREKWNVTKLLQGNTLKEQHQNAIEKGYVHLYGTSKYRDIWKDRIDKRFKQNYPTEYQSLMKKL